MMTVQHASLYSLESLSRVWGFLMLNSTMAGLALIAESARAHVSSFFLLLEGPPRAMHRQTWLLYENYKKKKKRAGPHDVVATTTTTTATCLECTENLSVKNLLKTQFSAGTGPRMTAAYI